MRRQDVESWAMGRGFAWEGDVLSIDYLESRMELHFGARTVKAIGVSDGKKQVVGRGYFDRLFVNELGVLEGLGLSTSMMMTAERLGVSPPWFTQSYCDVMKLPSPYRRAEGVTP